MKNVAIAMVAIGLLAGCAGTPVPADRYARSQAMVDSAEQAHADGDTRAAAHLQAAKDQLKLAKKLMRDGDNRSAAWVLARAEADGETALALARAQLSKADAERTIDIIKAQMSMVQGGGHGS